MKTTKKYILLFCIVLFGAIACKKQLDVKNPNEPTLADAKTEGGIISLASGAVYINGLNVVFNAGLNQLGSGFFYTAYAYQELMADIISASASNQNINVIKSKRWIFRKT